ncbi:MAG: M23 family metallopeptidase, partial [Candidatus Thorarchaeota archaeon]
TILDGHDFYSHHRRFAMSIVRKITENKFRSNFSRYALDFTVLGSDGNTRRMDTDEYAENYDFHFNDARKFYTDGCEVYAPADGRVVKCVDSLDDLYDSQFDMDNAIREDSIQEIAGNYVVIQHNEEEFSHLFHLMQDSVPVTAGDTVKKGQVIGNVGFSGAATTYSHLHYQLMNGSNFLIDEPLPCVFSDVVLIYGSQRKRFEKLAIDTGDIILSE